MQNRLRASIASTCWDRPSYQNVASELNAIFAHLPPLQSLQNRCPQLSQTCVNLRVRFPHLQHFRVTFCPPLRPLILYQKGYRTTYGEPTLRNLARFSRSRFRRPATNLKPSILSLFFCQRPWLLYLYQNLSPLMQQRGLNRGFHKTMS